jgi:hypothetical protein
MRTAKLALVAVGLLLALACGKSDKSGYRDAAGDGSGEGTLDRPANVATDVGVDRPADIAADVELDIAADVGPDGGPHHSGYAGHDGNSFICPGVGISCAPAACRNNTCVTACTSDLDCVGATRCKQGTCLGFGPDCTANDQCASGYCVQGVCCESACAGSCQTCNLPSARGKCVTLPPAMQPDGGCAADAGGN